MWNIIFGLIMVIGALSGKLVMRGTNSSAALGVLGAVLLIWGIVQVVRKRQH